ncbi:glyoxalase [Psychromicrobium xiongbiense]|uniref:glyoxalase n=1 Tax=Psychromicrobium xiongbiense TaxID=3051184 RepID=UPI0025546D1B|nr:glyoxalase [Psychromicrobium sp. YIM S02556]
MGFNADHDERPSAGIRFVQLTPPGSACSICIGEGPNDAPAGTAPSLQMEVSDIEVLDWGSFVYFADPDGNKWAPQNMPSRPNG